MKFKYLDKELLAKLNDVSEKVLKYNRTIPNEVIDQLPADKFFIVSPLMVHEHRAGKACDPHMRCNIYAGPDAAHLGYMILDIEMGLYDMLPEVDAPDTDGSPATEIVTTETVS